MLQSSQPIIFVLCCCVAAAVSTESSAAPLQFVTITRACGCPLTLFFPTSSSIREAYLAPALCLTQTFESIMKIICPRTDPLLRSTYLSIPVTVTSSSLLAEAQATLRPLLSDRKLTFLQPLSIREAQGSKLALKMERQSGVVTAFLRMHCSDPGCLDLFDFQERNALEQADVAVTLHVPGSNPVTMRRRIQVANESRFLTSHESPSVLAAPMCTNLKHHQTIRVDESCSVTVLKRTDKKGHFVIEPMLCYRGNHSKSVDAEEHDRMMILTLEMRSSRVRDFVHRELADLSPVSVTFMAAVSAQLEVSVALAQLEFENLRLSPDGDSAELRVRSASSEATSQLRLLLDGSQNLWSHVSFIVESQLLGAEAGCSWKNQVFALSSNDGYACDRKESSNIPGYHAINGLLCINPQFVKRNSTRSAMRCAMRCNREVNCQAFSTDSGSCHLFLFDKCSKNVRNCACDKRGRVFVKQQPGLEPGQLCPTGYGDDLCGVKYMMLNPGIWTASRSKCESESGLVIMADVMDAAEEKHIVSNVRRSHSNNIWLGGSLTSGLKGGWYWVGCNIPLSSNSSLWSLGEPNNSGNNEDTIEMRSFNNKLNDVPGKSTLTRLALCECVSPF